MAMRGAERPGERSAPLVAVGVLVAGVLGTSTAGAASTPGETGDAFSGVITVPLAAPALAPIVVGAALDYGWYPALQEEDGRTRRLGTQLSAAWSPTAQWSLRAGFRGVVGMTPESADRTDRSYYGEPELGARGVLELAPALYIGGELQARLVGASAPSVRWSALTSSLSGLLGWRLLPDTWFGLRLGYRLDRSGHAVAEPERVRFGDRLILPASSWDAALLGFGVTHRIRRTELLAEMSAEPLVGSGSPSPSASPWGAALGLRYHQSASLSLLAAAEASGTQGYSPTLSTSWCR
jgi:hypothetical protein